MVQKLFKVGTVLSVIGLLIVACLFSIYGQASEKMKKCIETYGGEPYSPERSGMLKACFDENNPGAFGVYSAFTSLGILFTGVGLLIYGGTPKNRNGLMYLVIAELVVVFLLAGLNTPGREIVLLPLMIVLLALIIVFLIKHRNAK